jgi:flagellin-like hook-associated protein FlgL
MPPRNPSELQRQEDMLDELRSLRVSLANPLRSKSIKEAMLREIRELERQLDLEHVHYNKG